MALAGAGVTPAPPPAPLAGASVGLLMPSRGRPGRAAVAAVTAAERATLPGTRVYVLVDGDTDPRYDIGGGAAGRVTPLHRAAIGRVTALRYPVHVGMVPTLNHYAVAACTAHTHLGYCGDDHLARTHGWDAVLAQAAGAFGLAYGDDLHQGEKLPTAVVISAAIVTALGFMAPPALRHLYVDNFWLDLGRGLRALRYVPQVIIEHLHPDAGKAPRDAGYAAVNSPQAYRRDAAAWQAYRTHRLPGDVAAVGAAVEAAAAATRAAHDTAHDTAHEPGAQTHA